MKRTIFWVIIAIAFITLQYNTLAETLLIKSDTDKITYKNDLHVLKITPLDSNDAKLSINKKLIIGAKENDSILHVEIQNFPNNNYDFVYYGIIPVISVLIGVYFGWWLNERRIRKQEFDNNFFNLLERQDDIRNNIQIRFQRDVGIPIEEIGGKTFFNWGKDYINNLYKYQKTFSTMEKERLAYSIKDIKHKAIIDDFYDSSIAREYKTLDQLAMIDIQQTMAKYTYRTFFNIYFNELGHYFRHLYWILKYIDMNESHIKKFSKIDLYSGILQARMSASELYFLFYDGLLFSKMKDYIERYKLIENLAVEDLMEDKHQELYFCKMKSRKILTTTEVD